MALTPDPDPIPDLNPNLNANRNSEQGTDGEGVVQATPPPMLKPHLSLMPFVRTEVQPKTLTLTLTVEAAVAKLYPNPTPNL